MNPNQGQPQNPFVALLQKLQGQGSQSPGQSMGQQSMDVSSAMGLPTTGVSGAASPMGGQQEIEDAAMPGQNPGVSKQLMGAMNQLHQAITTMTDPQEIRMIRSILILLGQLIQRDQETQDGKTGSFKGQNPGDPSFSGESQQGLPTGLAQGSPSPAM